MLPRQKRATVRPLPFAFVLRNPRRFLTSENFNVYHLSN